MPKRVEVHFRPQQVALLEGLQATAQRGTPTMMSLILQAVDEFIARELRQPGVQSAVDKYLGEHRKVVNLREVKDEEP